MNPEPLPTLGEELRRLHGRLAGELAELSGLTVQQLDGELGRMLRLCRQEIERRARQEARGADHGRRR